MADRPGDHDLYLEWLEQATRDGKLDATALEICWGALAEAVAAGERGDEQLRRYYALQAGQAWILHRIEEIETTSGSRYASAYRSLVDRFERVEEALGHTETRIERATDRGVGEVVGALTKRVDALEGVCPGMQKDQ